MRKQSRVAARMMVVVAAMLVAVVAAVQPVEAAARTVYASGSLGYDVSWPNCTTTPPSHRAFGIVGVTDGLGYSQNPCLATEAGQSPNLSLYVNTGWYDQSTHVSYTSPLTCAAGDELCLAYNYGYNAGLYALSYTTSQNVHANTWWLDVETGNTWNANTAQNRNSLQGEHDALIANGVTTVGIYSTTAQWNSITGSWLNNWPGWGATTVRTASQAAKYCTGHRFTGGPTYLIQFSGSVDQDYAC